MCIRSIKAIFPILLFSTLAACGGGSGDGSDNSVTQEEQALTQSEINAAQDALDGVTTVLDSSSALGQLSINSLQDELDEVTTSLDSSAGVLTQSDIDSIQDEFDSASSVLQ